MKASELVERLNNLIKCYGDKTVAYNTGKIDASVDTVEFQPEATRLGQLRQTFVIS